jgi:CDP-diacylglycerol--glycerol-3-phosphate 3-phosphatidyltransferase
MPEDCPWLAVAFQCEGARIRRLPEPLCRYHGGEFRLHGLVRMISIYQLKPAFQQCLRPCVGWLARRGVTANAVTAWALVLSLGVGIGLSLAAQCGQTVFFFILPLWMFLRMALNAIDGMLAREFGQKSALGAYLNELSDVIADAALFLPFVWIAPFGWASVGAVIFLSALSEMSGVLALRVGAARRYDGPMGKSDRAFLFGALGLWVAAAGALPGWTFWLMPLACAAMLLNMVNRIRGGLAAREVTGQ